MRFSCNASVYTSDNHCYRGGKRYGFYDECRGKRRNEKSVASSRDTSRTLNSYEYLMKRGYSRRGRTRRAACLFRLSLIPRQKKNFLFRPRHIDVKSGTERGTGYGCAFLCQIPGHRPRNPESVGECSFVRCLSSFRQTEQTAASIERPKPGCFIIPILSVNALAIGNVVQRRFKFFG